MPAVALVLALPGLLAPDAVAASAAAPSLARLVAAAGACTPEPDGVTAALARWYGIAGDDELPLAALRAAALGVDPGDAYWLAADPVTLEAGRDDVRLVGPVTDLSAGEAQALVATLDAHFAGDRLAFVAPEPGAWFVRASAPQRLRTRPLEVAAGRMLRTLLPSGRDAPRWRRWQNEIQMLLFEHPVNVARAGAARPVANSVWLWGGGTAPAPPTSTRSVRTFAAAGIAVALAAYARAPAQPLPPDLDAALAAASRVATIVVALDAPLAVDAVERAWAAPAFAALARGQLSSVTLIAGGGPGAVVWTAPRGSAWQRLRQRLRAPDLAGPLAAARARLGDAG